VKNGTVVGAVIGCGSISKSHITAMQKAGYVIGALCDTNKEAAEGRKKELCTPETEVFTDTAAMLKRADIDVVGVCTPPFLHCDQTVAALEAGKCVYCEKPVSHTLKDFKRIFAAEKKSGRTSYYTPCRMRSPTIRQQIADGKLGNVYRIDTTHFRWNGRSGVEKNTQSRWFADSRKAIAGITGDMGMYFFDRALHMTGWPEITSLSAVMYKEFPHALPKEIPYDVEEHALIMARTGGTLTLTFELANMALYDNGTVNTLDILGTKASIRSHNWQPGTRFITTKDGLIAGGAMEFSEIKLDTSADRSGDTAVYSEIAGLLKSKTPVQSGTTSEQMYRLHELLAMAFLSSHEKREVTPKDLDPSAQIFIAP